MIRAGGHGDQVLAPFVHENQGHARVARGVAQNQVDGDSFPLVVLDGLVAEHVAAHLGHEGDFGAKPCGGHGLIGALAASRQHKLPAGHRFARLGQPRGLDHHVGIGAADNDNAWGPHLVLALRVLCSHINFAVITNPKPTM